MAVGGRDVGETGLPESAGVWVFQHSAAGNWTQQGSVLTGTLASGTFQGSVYHAVALSISGSTLAIGFANEEGAFGGVWLFTAGAS